MAMNDAPTILLASEDPGRADLKYRFLRLTGNFKAHFLALHHVAEIPIYGRRNSFNRQNPIAVLSIRPVEPRPDLFPTMLTISAGDAKQRDLGGASPERLEGLRTPSK